MGLYPASEIIEGAAAGVILGFVAGAAFSTALGISEGRRRFDEMSLPRFALWGALGALLLSGWVQGADIVVYGVLPLLGAGSAAGSLALARRADDKELLEHGADVADIGLTEEEKRQLLTGQERLPPVFVGAESQAHPAIAPPDRRPQLLRTADTPRMTIRYEYPDTDLPPTEVSFRLSPSYGLTTGHEVHDWFIEMMHEHEEFEVETDVPGEWPVPFWSETVRGVMVGQLSALKLRPRLLLRTLIAGAPPAM